MTDTRDRPRHAELPDLTSKDLGDEYLFYDRAGDRVHVLNGTARRIYLLCRGDRTIDEVVDAITELYEIDTATAREDARKTIDSLVRLGLLDLG